MFKSLELKPWVSDPANAPLYPANYLYYPLYGALCRLLDLLGVFAGDPRRQMTILNAVSCSLCLAIVYLLIRAVTGDRLVALLSALFHLASSFVMFLAIINEDILPSYTVLLAAMALGSVWLARPTAARVVAVAVLFSLAWLMEWRLMFPTLPAMLAALWLCEERPARRLGWIALFLAGMLATAGVSAWPGRATRTPSARSTSSGRARPCAPSGRASPGPRSAICGTAWWPTCWARASPPSPASPAGTSGATPRRSGCWRSLPWPCPCCGARRRDPRARALAAVFGVTFVAGEVFNLYSQPQDPQMQINVMAWLTVAWALVLVAARQRYGARGLAAWQG